MNKINATCVFPGLFQPSKGSAAQVPRKTFNAHDAKQRQLAILNSQHEREQPPAMQAAPQFEPEENAELVNAPSPLEDEDEAIYSIMVKDGFMNMAGFNGRYPRQQ